MCIKGSLEKGGIQRGFSYYDTKQVQQKNPPTSFVSHLLCKGGRRSNKLFQKLQLGDSSSL
jgi:hypothetical protein